MTLSEELKHQLKPERQRGHGRRAFLAQRNEIAQALEDGYRAKEIWEHLHDKGAMPIQYRTFIDYVNRYILCTPQIARPIAGPEPPIQSTEAKKKKTGLTRRFEYDASGKSKDDLI